MPYLKRTYDASRGLQIVKFGDIYGAARFQALHTSKQDIADMDTTRSTDALIAQRIEELRAIAFGETPHTADDTSRSDIAASVNRISAIADSGRHLQAVPEVDPATTVTLRGRVDKVEASADTSPESASQPAQGGAPVTTSTFSPTYSAMDQHSVADRQTDSRYPGTISAAIERVNLSLTEEVARVEQLLRGWGNPTTAIDESRDHLKVSLQRVEHSMRKEMNRVHETVQALIDGQGPVSDRVMEIMAASTLQYERLLNEQTATLDKAMALTRAQLPDDVFHRVSQSLTGIEKLASSVHELGNGFRDVEDVIATSSKSVVSSVARALEVSQQLAEEGFSSFEDGLNVARDQITDRIEESLTSTNRHIERSANETLQSIAKASSEALESISKHSTTSTDVLRAHMEVHADGLADTTRTVGTQISSTIEQSSQQLHGAIDAVGATVQAFDGSLDEIGEHLTEHVVATVNESLQGVQDRAERHAAQLLSAARRVGIDVSAVVDQVKSDLRTEMSGMHSELQVLRVSLPAALSETSATLRTDVEAVTTQLIDSQASIVPDVTVKVDEALAEIKARIAESEKKVATRFEDTRARIGQAQKAIEGSRTNIDERIAILNANLDERLSIMGTSVTDRTRSVEAKVEQLSHSLDGRFSEQGFRISEAASTVLEHVETQLENQLRVHADRVVAAMEPAIDHQLAIASGRMVDATKLQLEATMQATRERLLEDTTRHSAVAAAKIEESREQLEHSIGALRDSFITELDDNRLQHVRDIETVIDSMSQGWAAMCKRFEANDRRLENLEETIGIWFTSLSDEADENLVG